MARSSMPPAETPPALPAEGAKLSRAEQAKLAEYRTQAMEVLANAGLPVEYSYDSFVEILKSAALQCARASVVMGSALLAIRANEPAARFQQVLEQIGLGEDSAMTAMALARHCAKSPAHKKIHDVMGGTKALALFRHVADEDIKALAYDEDRLDELAGKSTRQLAAELRAAREEALADLEAKSRVIARKDKKISELQELLERRSGGPDAAQVQAGELMTELGTVTAEALRAITEVERVMAEIHKVHREAGHTVSVALSEQMHGQAMLVAKRVGALTNYGAKK